jgi:hypothetical protein
MKTKLIKSEIQPEQPVAPIADSLANIEIETELEKRNGFTLFRKGTAYSVKNPVGQVIAPFTGKDEAEQLFRNMSRKF